MSELIQKNDNHATIRWKLLTGASALALTAYVSSGPIAMAGDDGQPQIWIEAGGQLNRLEDGQEAYAPPFMNGRPAIFPSSQSAENPSRYSIDETGKISFEPDGSDWVLAASVLYGRSARNKHDHEQTHPADFIPTKYGVPSPIPPIPPLGARFADTLARNSENHFILDFQAGKDVGLGISGEHGSSVLSLGVRFAQFESRSNTTLESDPDWHWHTKYIRGLKIARQPYHTNVAHLSAARSFHGVGPSLSWRSSVPLAGNSQSGELAFDWGLSAAVLFGRQRTKVSHQETSRYHSSFNFYHGSRPVVYHPTPVNVERTKSVTVPNVGGFAGASWRIQDFKVSFGYKADFFFNAMDGGIDARKSTTRGFYGPFASISVGLGD